jgi:hypothetical protein
MKRLLDYVILPNRLTDFEVTYLRWSLARVEEQAQAIARRLGKEPLRVDVDPRDLRLEPGRWAPFWSAFTHVIRNAVDHGLESSEDRAKADKPAEGVLRLATPRRARPVRH